ncbi:MAG: hypothetical protein CFE21_14735 [Bacteroidetes bacterium B1(2017)]|nr:MAG: hypothetical protein CFE21_14735 [Bacteroidetes bacterium B1(2017)]
MKKLLPVFIFGFIALFATCKHEPNVLIKGLPGDPNDTFTVTEAPIPNLPTSDSICFTTQILPLFQTACAMRSGCHVSPGGADGVSLVNYAQIKARLTKSMSEINKNAMPYSVYPKLDPAAIALLNKWISQGARLTDCYNSNCDTANVKYTTHIAPIMSMYCRGCHNATDANGNIKLHTYAEVKTNTQSGLVLCTAKGRGCKFMPKGGIHIGTCNVRKIQLWLDAGCPQ